MKVLNVKNEQEFRQWCSEQDAMAEESQLSRNQPISRLPETDQEIRIQEGKER